MVHRLRRLCERLECFEVVEAGHGPRDLQQLDAGWHVLDDAPACRRLQQCVQWDRAAFTVPRSAATGDRRYLDLANRLWWKTTDYLYDKEEHLCFRDSRYFDQREPNGKKVFWSQGNGWVIAGLVRVLQEMPDDYPDRAGARGASRRHARVGAADRRQARRDKRGQPKCTASAPCSWRAARCVGCSVPVPRFRMRVNRWGLAGVRPLGRRDTAGIARVRWAPPL
jgi:hypothetical protein